MGLIVSILKVSVVTEALAKGHAVKNNIQIKVLNSLHDI